MKEQSFTPSEPTVNVTKPHKKGYTRVQNHILDNVIPDLNAGQIKVYLYICRRTVGWNKKWADISLGEFRSGTKMRKINEVINDLIAKDLIVRHKTKDRRGKTLRLFALTESLMGGDQDSANGISYSDYLQTPEWEKRRAEHLKAARYACQLCNKVNETLHVHHRTYENVGRELFADLIVLCAKCHARFHGKEGE